MQANNKLNIKALHYWPFVTNYTAYMDLAVKNLVDMMNKMICPSSNTVLADFINTVTLTLTYIFKVIQP